MPTVHISVGSNIDREESIRSAISELRLRFGSLTLSSVYDTKAVGFDGDDFYNLIVAFESSESPQNISHALNKIEEKCGRTPEQKKFNSRTLDLDLTLYGDHISADPKLQIPRKEITQYAFVLEPLAEIAGHLKHPVSKLSYKALWQAFDKSDLVQKIVTFQALGNN